MTSACSYCGGSGQEPEAKPSNPAPEGLKPDEAVGFALIAEDGTPYPSTVAATERGAQVNALCSVWYVFVGNDWTDAKIAEWTRQHCAASGHRIGPVYIGPLEVSDG